MPPQPIGGFLAIRRNLMPSNSKILPRFCLATIVAKNAPYPRTGHALTARLR